jgi:hypothetical protein
MRDRVGRNDPCPCGSGRKYKSCCLDGDPTRIDRAAAGHVGAVLLADQTSSAITRLANENRARFDAEYPRPTQEARAIFAARVGAGLDARDAAEALEAYIGELEARIAAIVSRRSRGYWFYLSRRLPPRPLHGVRPWTAVLYLTVFTLALLKYGTAAVDDLVLRDDQLFPDEVTFEDVLALHQVLELAYEHNHAAAAYRRVGKGAVIRPGDNDNYATPGDPDTERRIRLLDDRVARYQDILSHAGSMASIQQLPDGPVDPAALPLLFPVPNAGQEDAPAWLLGLGGVERNYLGRPNFLPYMAQLAGLRRVLLLFADALVTTARVHPDELIGVLVALGSLTNAWLHTRPEIMFQFMQRGYAVTGTPKRFAETQAAITREYRRYLEQVGSEKADPSTAEAAVTRVLEYLSYTGEGFSTLSLWDRRPLKLLLRVGDHVFWDLSALPAIAGDTLTVVGSLSGDTGNLKGENFQTEMADFLRGQEGLSVWRCSELLKAAGQLRDVDASFIVGDTLWIVECKARAANIRAMRGDYAALQDRWEQTKDDLCQARTLAEFVRNFHRGQHWELPPNIARITHCVCTPFAEHMYELGERYWLANNVPRVCLPRELVDFARTREPDGTIDVPR